MARFSHIEAGLVPVELKAPPRITPKAMNEVFCEHCGGQVGFRSSRRPVESPCSFCRTFFGTDFLPGCTHDSPEEAEAKLARIREAGWVMILKRGRFGSASGEVVVEPGDIFKAGRVGDEPRRQTPEVCSRERTKALYTVSLILAGVELVQFTHEVAPISFQTVMDLKRRGELVENFVSSDDSEGHFVPTPELRAEIYATFGKLVNAE